MAGRTLPLARSGAKTSLDQERENFEKSQILAISKAINEIEVPLKTKHVRSAIIGTFQEKGSFTFWSNIHRMPIHGNPIIAWKFCHTLHKLLREGHPNVLKDSFRHRDFLVDNGKLWGHLKEGYGRLIYLYCRVLVTKLDFHKRNPRFPGNLHLTEDLEQACENDVNSYFQLSVEFLDFMDEILNLQSAVFGSLDMSRSNSMTNAGQCRLAPLIPCIQDSSQIYDYTVKLLFKLHNCLPSDTLEGHRLRFLKQFRALRQFYLQSSTLQYFKNLIQVPYLDENPPNFLISSELSRHVTPVVILPQEQPPPSEDMSLVQLADSEERNQGSSPDLLAERDRYIEHLLHQLEQLSSEVRKIRNECQRQIEEMQTVVQELELRLAERELELEEALTGKRDIEKKLSDAAQSAQLGSVVQLQLQESETKAKGWEEKFSKLKEVYQKLRDEHITLLRQKADADKRLTAATVALDESTKIQSELQDSLELLRAQSKEITWELDNMKSSSDETIRQLSTENQQLLETKNNLQISLATNEEQVASLNVKLTDLEKEKKNLEDSLDNVKHLLSEKDQAIQEMREAFENSQSNVSATYEELAACKLEHNVQIQTLVKERDDILLARDELQQTVEKLEDVASDINAKLANVQCEKQELLLQLENSQAVIKQLTEREQELSQALEQQKLDHNSVLETSNNVQEDLRSSLNNAVAIMKKKDEDFSAYKFDKECAIAQLEGEKNKLLVAIADMQDAKITLEESLARTISSRDVQEQEKLVLLQQLEALRIEQNAKLLESQSESMKLLIRLLVDCSSSAEQYMVKCVDDLSKPPVAAMTILDQNGISVQGATSLLELLRSSLHTYIDTPNHETISRVIPLVFPFTQSVGHALIQGQLMAHGLPDIEKADKLLASSMSLGNHVIRLHRTLQKTLDNDEIRDVSDNIRAALQLLESLADSAIAAMKAAEGGNVGEELENELGAMERAIEEAAARIASLWDTSKRSQTGVELEVNGKVLDSCTTLMKAIIELIKRAKVLQDEIVGRGKGSATAKEFYKRNHRWTEGLLSAAKAVGFGAKLLTDAADKVVQGQAKFEQLTVASQEIAASTAQLVFASRVKAELSSKNLQSLSEASKAVSLATGGVVATAKHCAELVEDSTVLDLSKLTLHQTKRLEMESQVKVLEYESCLEKERLRLSALRRQHYQLAGETDN